MGDEETQADNRIARARDGDQAALALLLTASRKNLVDRVRRRLPANLQGTVDADDIIQNAHVEVFQHISEFEFRGAESFDRWVATIAIRKLRDAIKRQRSAKRGGGQTAAPTGGGGVQESMIALLDLAAAPGRTPSRCVARLEAVSAVQEALDALPEHYRRAIWHVHIEGRPVSEIARVLGRTDRAVHGLIRRGMKMLREHLGSDSRFLSSG